MLSGVIPSSSSPRWRIPMEPGTEAAASGCGGARPPRTVLACPGGCGSSALVDVQLELLDLAPQRVASPAQPLRRFHPVSTGVGERAHDQRALEFLFQPV